MKFKNLQKHLKKIVQTSDMKRYQILLKMKFLETPCLPSSHLRFQILCRKIWESFELSQNSFLWMLLGYIRNEFVRAFFELFPLQRSFCIVSGMLFPSLEFSVFGFILFVFGKFLLCFEISGMHFLPTSPTKPLRFNHLSNCLPSVMGLLAIKVSCNATLATNTIGADQTIVRFPNPLA